jgi:uncharacterized protein YodC (DUF2158 family)
MSEFKVGDVVRLKSGSEPMTVENIKQAGSEDKYVVCRHYKWEKREFSKDYFFPDMLVHLREDSIPKQKENK